MKQDASENKLFNPLEMNPLFKSMLIIGFINLLFIGCTQPIPVPQTSLYKRLGGEKTLVAFSLQVSRKPKIQEAIGSDQGRISANVSANGCAELLPGLVIFPAGRSFFRKLN